MDRRRQGRAVKELENLFVIVWVMLSFYGIEKAATKDIHMSLNESYEVQYYNI